MKPDFSSVRLCVLVAGGVSRLPFEALVREVVAGGADCIQLREKSAAESVILSEAAVCRNACGAARSCLFIMNDRPDLAVRAGADGVHIGSSDTPPTEARRIIGPDRVLGVSAYTVEEIRAAEAAGADYLGVGAVFPTATKEIEIRGLEIVREAARAASIHWLAIGGITQANVRDVILAGAPGIAVFSAIVAAENPRKATREMKERIERAIAERGRGGE